jgi:hypothetical protein
MSGTTLTCPITLTILKKFPPVYETKVTNNSESKLAFRNFIAGEKKVIIVIKTGHIGKGFMPNWRHLIKLSTATGCTTGCVRIPVYIKVLNIVITVPAA